jgi:hypothetical protein
VDIGGLTTLPSGGGCMGDDMVMQLISSFVLMGISVSLFTIVHFMKKQ